MFSCDYIMHFDSKSCLHLGRKACATKHLVKPGLLYLKRLSVSMVLRQLGFSILLPKLHHARGLLVKLHLYSDMSTLMGI